MTLPDKLAKRRDELRCIWAKEMYAFPLSRKLRDGELKTLGRVPWDTAWNACWEEMAHVVEALERIKKRFDDEDKGGMPRAGMAWAMWCDAKEALAKLEGK